MLARNLRWKLATSIALAVLTGACTQLTMLRDYGPTVPPNTFPGLAGKTICLTGFKTAFVWDQLPDEPIEAKTELDGFEYVEVTDAEEDRWDDDLDELEDSVPEEQRTKIGEIGFHPLFSVTDPGQYFAQVLAFDLGAQGAKVLQACTSADADFTVGGSLTHLDVDQAFYVGWSSAVVHVELANRAGPIGKRVLRTAGSNAVGWGDVRFENYRVVREAAQRVSRLLLGELQARAASAPVAPPPPTTPVAEPQPPADANTTTGASPTGTTATGAAVPGPAATTAPGAPVPTGCTKDTDCKGDRICNKGRCMAPAR